MQEGTRDIKDQDTANRIFEVGRHQALKLLLPRSIPQLKSTRIALKLDILAHKIHPNGRLHHQKKLH